MLFRLPYQHRPVDGRFTLSGRMSLDNLESDFDRVGRIMSNLDLRPMVIPYVIESNVGRIVAIQHLIKAGQLELGCGTAYDAKAHQPLLDLQNTYSRFLPVHSLLLP
jgi:hypothetical protein